MPHRTVNGRTFPLSLAFTLLAVPGFAADGVQTYRLWEGDAPGAVGKEDPDVPTITLYPAPRETATGTSIVVCPGGGYAMLAVDHEGKQVAEWLNSIGVTAAVLKYRLAPRYRHPAPLDDARRALRTVRARAGEWGLDPRRVGIMGFSAGGHLASTAGTHFDAGAADATDPVERQSSRPDFLILAYPVITLQEPFAHMGSRRNLLGPEPAEDLVRSLSNETQVTSETPPTFLVHTDADAGVVAENSLQFALALRRAKVPVELHLFEKGPHGLGLGGGAPQFRIAPEPSFQAWPKLCETWMAGRGLLDRPGSGARR